ncbi:MAG: hydrogenase nickel incorporation protein HypB [Gammaproteobacteria bacterium]|nr:hydrogenase nickel incorporation protein HypB [Gammaproteobacteria bacterium]
MCKDCGCQDALKGKLAHHQHHQHHHDHSHGHDHAHIEADSKTLTIEQNVLQKNDDIAHHNWHWLDDHRVITLNMMSSPGAGKTALLEATLTRLKDRIKISILVGDQQTDHDAKRLQAKGVHVKQINTYSSCHLDAAMIQKELGGFVSGHEDLLIIENVGNLVCPAAFDLGEKQKIALLSVTEGEDKPAKYPVLFHDADVIVITKVDLVPHLDWDRQAAIKYIRQVNSKADVIELSAKTGAGMDSWCDYLLRMQTLTEKSAI